MVDIPRSWQWSPGREQGRPSPKWTYEKLDLGDAAWFARLSLTKSTMHPPVVLVHGVVVSGTYFQPVASHLNGDLDIYIPDLPGTGRSITRTGLWDITRLAEGLGRWMDIHQIRGAILVSNSFGCQVLTMLAAKRPELIHSLILLSPTMDPAVNSVVRILARGVRDIPRERLGLWKVWIPDVVRTGPLRGLRTLRMALRDPQLDRLGAVRAPVIVVGGERDPIAPRAWIESMASRFPNGRSINLPDAPHAMNYSRPDEIARIIRSAAAADPGS